MAWLADIDARNLYLDEAIKRYVIARFDGIVALRADESAKLQPLIDKIMDDYRIDISNACRISSIGERPWHLEMGGLMLIVGLPETELRAALTNEQMEAWTSSGDYLNGRAKWQDVQAWHDLRLRKKK